MFESPDYAVHNRVEGLLAYVEENLEAILRHGLDQNKEVLPMFWVRGEVLSNHWQSASQNNLYHFNKDLQHFSFENSQARRDEENNLRLFDLIRLLFVDLQRKQNHSFVNTKKLFMAFRSHLSYNALQQINNVLSNRSKHL